MKILAFCSDLLPFPGLPTSGGGLRCWQLIESLRQLGHEVVISMPVFTFLAKQFAGAIPEEIRADAWDNRNQDELIERHRPDAVLFSSTWIVDRLHRAHDCLMIYDLHGPQLLEQHYKKERDTTFNCQVKVEKLAKADFVLCAGERQRHYFFPFLLLAGHDVEALQRFAVVPIACPENLPTHEYPATMRIVLGGGFFPWQDPRTGLQAIREVFSSSPAPNARVQIFGTSHGITGDDDVEFAALKAELAQTPNVEFLDFVPRDELTEIYRHASLALDLHARNPERELAFTTRTVEYLWLGLPVLYNNYGELAGLIREYDAGWTVDPDNLSAVCQTLSDILAAPEEIARKGRNAQTLVSERLTYSGTIGPLAEFLANPTRHPKQPPAKILPMAEYLGYREILKSRAVQAATTVSAWRRKWMGTAR